MRGKGTNWYQQQKTDDECRQPRDPGERLRRNSPAARQGSHDDQNATHEQIDNHADDPERSAGAFRRGDRGTIGAHRRDDSHGDDDRH